MSILFVVESAKPLDRLVADLEQAVSRHKFGVLGVHNLKKTMAKKGVAFQRECRIFEVCNPHQAKKVLEGGRRGGGDAGGHHDRGRPLSPTQIRMPDPRVGRRRPA